LVLGSQFSVLGSPHYQLLPQACQGVCVSSYNGAMQIKIETPIDDQMAAAIMAALALLLDAENAPVPDLEPRRSAWARAGILEGQGLPGTRSAVAWSTADRIGRASRW
jgi:hypothetical protein